MRRQNCAHVLLVRRLLGWLAHPKDQDPMLCPARGLETWTCRYPSAVTLTPQDRAACADAEWGPSSNPVLVIPVSMPASVRSRPFRRPIPRTRTDGCRHGRRRTASVPTARRRLGGDVPSATNAGVISHLVGGTRMIASAVIVSGPYRRCSSKCLASGKSRKKLFLCGFTLHD